MSHFESILKNLNLAHSDLNHKPGQDFRSQRVTFIVREHFSMLVRATL